MSRADEIFAQNMTDIIENGFWDTELEVRPRWEDGTPAHTVKKFGVVNRYNLQEEFPILTMRRTARDIPIMDEVGFNISLIPGPPLGPS